MKLPEISEEFELEISGKNRIRGKYKEKERSGMNLAVQVTAPFSPEPSNDRPGFFWPPPRSHFGGSFRVDAQKKRQLSPPKFVRIFLENPPNIMSCPGVLVAMVGAWIWMHEFICASYFCRAGFFWILLTHTQCWFLNIFNQLIVQLFFKLDPFYPFPRTGLTNTGRNEQKQHWHKTQLEQNHFV